jgi:hypothetical protein
LSLDPDISSAGERRLASEVKIGRWGILAGVLAGAALCGCVQSLYATQPDEVPPNDGDDYVLVAPYFVNVGNKINVAITPPLPKTSSPSTPQSQATIITITLTPVPSKRAWLYFRKNSWFTNSFSVSVGNDGLLTTSDTSSQQMVTGILTELAQTAGEMARVLAVAGKGGEKNPLIPLYDQGWCSLRILQFTGGVGLNNSLDRIYPASQTYLVDDTNGPYKDPSGNTITDVIPGGAADGKKPTPVTKNVKLWLKLEVPQELVTGTTTVDLPPHGQPGFIAYTPVPVIATLLCSVEKSAPIQVSQPAVLYPYFASRYVDPKRDFLTDPSETFALSGGFMTGHKYADQSGGKTIVDTITAPIRAIFPSVSVMQSVQTGGGKPEQITTTTTTTPPKTQ